jgi:hypothetical protein
VLNGSVIHDELCATHPSFCGWADRTRRSDRTRRPAVRNKAATAAASKAKVSAASKAWKTKTKGTLETAARAGAKR